MPSEISERYVTSAPSSQNALDIFSGEWSSRFPGALATLNAGTVPLFEDPRVAWALAELGDMSGKSVLELDRSKVATPTCWSRPASRRWWRSNPTPART